jgi:hypothetical protein
MVVLCQKIASLTSSSLHFGTIISNVKMKESTKKKDHTIDDAGSVVPFGIIISNIRMKEHKEERLHN